MKKYLILGKSGAGSLIPEFLFTELGIDYDIQYTTKNELVKSTSKGYNPLGKIPVLILPLPYTIYTIAYIEPDPTSTFIFLLEVHLCIRYIVSG